jgi:hypothetical protein
LDRTRALDAELAKRRGAEVTESALIERASAIAKEWLKNSQQLRGLADALLPALDRFDTAATKVLTSTKARTRASSYRKKLSPFVEDFFDALVIPIIRYEGSPAQVAARQLESIFSGAVSLEELEYIKEAARCTSVHCHRASMVLLWAAAIARLHTAIQKIGFNAFNAAMTAAVAKKGPPFNRIRGSGDVSTLAELQRMPDFNLLVVGMDLWKYDLQAFEELERLLGLRNSAAHPGMFVPNALEVQQFGSKLRKFVFESVKL